MVSGPAPFYIAKMATIEGMKCAALLNIVTIWNTQSQYSYYIACCYASQCEHTSALNRASVSMAICE